jgi:KaiC/GvpD/RAD55 family RecA-like ATPase
LFTFEKQEQLLNALSADLGLMKNINNYAFRIDEKDFDGVNREWFKLIKKAKEEKEYPSINQETLELLNPNLPVHMSNVTNAKVDFLNSMEAYVQHKAQENTISTVKEINLLTKKLLVTKDEQQRNFLIDKVNQVTKKLKKTSFKWNTRTPIDIIDQDFVYEDDIGRIPTYLDTLDEVLGGGFYRKGIHVLSAEPHNGKTSAGVQFATLQAWNGYKVLYISLEQVGSDITENALSVLAEKESKNRSYWEVGKFKNEKEAEVKRLEAKELINSTLLHYLQVEDFEFGLEEIVERIRFAMEEEGFQIIYVDNFQNVKVDDMNKTAQFERLADDMMSLSKVNNVPIIALSQLSVDNKGNKKTKYAARLNENAITNIEVYRVKPDPEKEGDDVEHIFMKIRKNRKGKGFLGKDLKFVFVGEKSIIGQVKRKAMIKKNSHNRSEDEMKKLSENGTFQLVGYNTKKFIKGTL